MRGDAFGRTCGLPGQGLGEIIAITCCCVPDRGHWQISSPVIVSMYVSTIALKPFCKSIIFDPFSFFVSSGPFIPIVTYLRRTINFSERSSQRFTECSKPSHSLISNRSEKIVSCRAIQRYCFFPDGSPGHHAARYLFLGLLWAELRFFQPSRYESIKFFILVIELGNYYFFFLC